MCIGNMILQVMPTEQKEEIRIKKYIEQNLFI